MRISFSFGGGPHHHNRGPRHHRHRHYHGHRSSTSVGAHVTLGPVGSAIMGIVFAIIGIVIMLTIGRTFMEFGAGFIPMLIGGIFCIIGIIVFVSNIKKVSNNKDNDSSLGE